MRYQFEIFDGEEWFLGNSDVTYDTPEMAKKAGVEMGFEYVRVVPAAKPGQEKK